MRAFACERCQQLVFFENSTCLHCHAALGFVWAERELRGYADSRPPRCANASIAACNWVPDIDGALCASCELTRTRPSDDDPVGLAQLPAAEAAKRRLLFELAELGLPVTGAATRPGGLAFDLLSSAHGPVTTGHADGLVTLDLAESDAAHRETLRTQMHEPYRTVLGHFRHEIGHYYFPLLAPEGPLLDRARELFGDDREDYSAAMQRHYAEGAPADWADAHVSAYATMHPWEDWAETFAHYLHIRDTLQTAGAYGVRVAGPHPLRGSARAAELRALPSDDPESGDWPTLLEDWLPLTYALNALNRSMGLDDLYPFVLAEPVVRKLAFVHGLVRLAHTPAAA